MDLSIDELSKFMNNNKSLCSPNAPFRYLPKSILKTAKNDFIINSNPAKVLEYICSSFYIYRNTVNRGFFAPHVLVDDAYEWPAPAYFEWSDVDSVITLGNEIHWLGASKGVISLEYIENNKVHSKNISGINGKLDYNVREIIPHLDEMHKLFKYRIDDASKVSVLFSDIWQNASLQRYATPLAITLMQIESGKLSKDDVGNGIMNYLDKLNDYIPEY